VAASYAAAQGVADIEAAGIGHADASPFAAGFGRAQFGNIIATARTSVLPQPTATSEVLPEVTIALAPVTPNIIAQSRVMTAAVSVKTEVMPNAQASSHVIDD